MYPYLDQQNSFFFENVSERVETMNETISSKYT